MVAQISARIFATHMHFSAYVIFAIHLHVLHLCTIEYLHSKYYSKPLKFQYYAVNSAVPQNPVFEAPKYSSVSGHYNPNNISPSRNFLSQSAYSPSSTYACGGENNNPTAPTARNKFNQPIDTAKRPPINGYPGLYSALNLENPFQIQFVKKVFAQWLISSHCGVLGSIVF